MFAQQGDNRNRIKKLCFYSLFTCLCIVFGFVETLIPTSAIAPGIKLGLANSVSLLLIINGDNFGAAAVNFSRIVLSALLFGSPFSFVFSFVAGAFSLLICIILSKSKKISAIGISIAGGVTHNIIQTVIAFFLLKKGVFFYMPLLILSGMLSGAVIGVLALLLSKKLKSIDIL